MCRRQRRCQRRCLDRGLDQVCVHPIRFSDPDHALKYLQSALLACVTRWPSTRPSTGPTCGACRQVLADSYRQIFRRAEGRANLNKKPPQTCLVYLPLHALALNQIGFSVGTYICCILAQQAFISEDHYGIHSPTQKLTTCDSAQILIYSTSLQLL